MQGAVLQIGTSVEHQQQVGHEAGAPRQAAMGGFVEIKIAGDERVCKGEGLAEGEA